MSCLGLLDDGELCMGDREGEMGCCSESRGARMTTAVSKAVFHAKELRCSLQEKNVFDTDVKDGVIIYDGYLLVLYVNSDLG